MVIAIRVSGNNGFLNETKLKERENNFKEKIREYLQSYNNEDNI